MSHLNLLKTLSVYVTVQKYNRSEVPHHLCPLSVCSVSLPNCLHLNPVSGAVLEGGQSVGGVTVGRLGDIDGIILGGVGHSEGVALGVVG